MSEPPAEPAAKPEETAAEKALRRHKRHLRKARADGLLAGIAAMLRPGDLAVDCGANIGVVTRVLAASGADVVAFEPDPYAFERLAHACADQPRVELVQAAVGVGEGRVRLMRAENFAANPAGASVKSTLLTGGRMIDPGQGVEVDMIDFPAFLEAQIAARGEIAFVKMDIEGAELDLLEALDARGLIAPIRCLVAETHERKFRDLRPRFRALRQRFARKYPAGKVDLNWI